MLQIIQSLERYVYCLAIIQMLKKMFLFRTIIILATSGRRWFEKADNTIIFEYHSQIKSCLSCCNDIIANKINVFLWLLKAMKILLDIPVLITSSKNKFISFFQLCLFIFLSVIFVMLVNLLIAMMGDTYTKIAEIKNEWMRQVYNLNVL